MKLAHEVTFDSLTAVRQEIDEWFGSTSTFAHLQEAQTPSRDLLVSVLIHRLADELSDVELRSRLHTILANFTRTLERAS
jgi:hypothetical protein